jgi:hypothetical protein
MEQSFRILLSLSLILTLPKAWAAADDDYVFYENIVEELRSSAQKEVKTITDPFEELKIHAEVGLVSNYISINSPTSNRMTGLLSGFEVQFGIDLFSPYWQAETSLKNFSTTQINRLTSASLKEFDLKIVHIEPLQKRIYLKMGAGLAARYLKTTNAQNLTSETSTPSSLIDLALFNQLSRNVSIGAEIGHRSSLISDTSDKVSWLGALKVHAQF